MGVLDNMPSPILRRGEKVSVRVGKNKGKTGTVKAVEGKHQWLIHDVWIEYDREHWQRPQQTARFKCYNLERID